MDVYLNKINSNKGVKDYIISYNKFLVMEASSALRASQASAKNH